VNSLVGQSLLWRSGEERKPGAAKISSWLHGFVVMFSSGRLVNLLIWARNQRPSSGPAIEICIVTLSLSTSKAQASAPSSGAYLT
jgi:hypothetical protein